MGPVYDFVNHTPQRVPLTDWYQTADARMQGFPGPAGDRRGVHQDARRSGGVAEVTVVTAGIRHSAGVGSGSVFGTS